MKINQEKLELALARNCQNLSALRGEGLSPMTLTRLRRGVDVQPVTVGKIARALGVDPIDIIEREGTR